MAVVTISVASFSKLPGGRFKKDGPFSGEEFRDSVLKPALLEAAKRGDTVVVELDGVSGYASSFLEEAFGGIVRANIIDADRLSLLLSIRSSDPVFAGFKSDALRYFERAIKIARAA